jgi:hypothetical protein
MRVLILCLAVLLTGCGEAHHSPPRSFDYWERADLYDYCAVLDTDSHDTFRLTVYLGLNEDGWFVYDVIRFDTYDEAIRYANSICQKGMK